MHVRYRRPTIFEDNIKIHLRKYVRRVMTGRNCTVSGSVAMVNGMAVRKTVRTP
jgi:hypothetical protein